MDLISEQRKYLSENLVVEALRLYESNQEDIKEFSQAKSGNVLAEYLNNNAWDDDKSNDTRVFLVRDKKTRKIAYYYALNCGILYKELNTMEMSLVEKACVEKLIKALRQVHSKELRAAELDSAYELLTDAYGLFDEKIEDSNRATDLISYAQDQAKIKDEREEATNQVGEGDFVKNVQETYPAIDIKFICRDANYEPDVALDFKFGVYVFWDIIVPHILKIAELVGCKYVYLFAADNSNLNCRDALMHDSTADVDLEDDLHEEIGNEDEMKRLVSYYITNLNFRPVSEYTFLKPHFERTCYTLIQEVDELSYQRELVWLSHDHNNEIDTCSD